jgi:hypothetical protein
VGSISLLACRNTARTVDGAMASVQDNVQAASRGGQVIGEVVNTIGDIRTASNRIGKIIDGIAFQTNILALNAAVEGAHAGEQGRAFADTSTATREQLAGVGQVGPAVQELDQATQQNGLCRNSEGRLQRAAPCWTTRWRGCRRSRLLKRPSQPSKLMTDSWPTIQAVTQASHPGCPRSPGTLSAISLEWVSAISGMRSKYLNNIVEQDHRAIKRRTRPMMGFKSFESAVKIIAGIETMHMVKKGQLGCPGDREGVRCVGIHDCSFQLPARNRGPSHAQSTGGPRPRFQCSRPPGAHDPYPDANGLSCIAVGGNPAMKSGSKSST